jgi:hypothetical protein
MLIHKNDPFRRTFISLVHFLIMNSHTISTQYLGSALTSNGSFVHVWHNRNRITNLSNFGHFMADIRQKKKESRFSLTHSLTHSANEIHVIEHGA